MVWERIKRISEGELPPAGDGVGSSETGIRLDRAPPALWAERFARASAQAPGGAARLSGAEVLLGERPDDDPDLAALDARILRANLLYEAEVLSPAVLEILEDLEARDPSDLVVRQAQTAGPDRDREEADLAAQELSNAGALLVENEAADISQPVDARLSAELIRAGAVDRTG